MAYPKPLSQKTLDKMYLQAGIDEKKKAFLQDFFMAASNLYGSMFLRDLWDVYTKIHEEQGFPKLKRKDFLSFSEIARREEQPYRIYEINEVYVAEKVNALDRMLVNKEILWSGYGGQFTVLYELVEAQGNKPLYIPENFLQWKEMQVLSFEKNFEGYLANLKVTAKTVKVGIKEIPCEHIGERLGDFDFLNSFERFCADEYAGKTPNGPKKNEKKLAEHLYDRRGPESAKIVRDLKWRILTGWAQEYHIKYVLEELEEVGVQLSEKKFEKMMGLYQQFVNNTHLWCNCGWTATDLAAKTFNPNATPQISFGPGFQKAFAEGSMDKDDLIRRIRDMGWDVSE